MKDTDLWYHNATQAAYVTVLKPLLKEEIHIARINNLKSRETWSINTRVVLNIIQHVCLNNSVTIHTHSKQTKFFLRKVKELEASATTNKPF